MGAHLFEHRIADALDRSKILYAFEDALALSRGQNRLGSSRTHPGEQLEFRSIGCVDVHHTHGGHRTEGHLGDQDQNHASKSKWGEHAPQPIETGFASLSHRSILRGTAGQDLRISAS